MAKLKGRRWTLLLTVMATVLISVPTAVWASHQFTDVPDSHIFHTGISWMKDNNITVGCNPPANTRFCPDDNVTRGQMATFMKRLAENTVVDAATLDGLTPADVAPISVVGGTTASSFAADLAFSDMPGAETTITVPTGYTALIIARYAAESACVGGDYASVRILLDGNEMAPVVGTDFAFDSSDSATETAGSWESHAMERFQADVGAGAHTVTAQVSTGCVTFRVDDWSLVAEARIGGSASLAGLGTQGADSQGR
jgi:hypothetical protein